MADLKQVPSSPEARKWYEDAQKQAGQIDQLLQYHDANEEHVMQLSKKLEQSLQMLKACQEACQEQWKIIDTNQRIINKLQKDSVTSMGNTVSQPGPAKATSPQGAAQAKPSPKAKATPSVANSRPYAIDYDNEEIPDEIKDKLKALERELQEAEEEKRFAEEQLRRGRSAEDGLTSQLMMLMQGLTEEEKRELCRDDDVDEDDDDDDVAEEDGWEDDLTPEQMAELMKLRQCLAMAEEEKAKQESVLKTLKQSLNVEAEQMPSRSPSGAKGTPKGGSAPSKDMGNLQQHSVLQQQLSAVEEEQRRTKQDLEAGRQEEAMLLAKLAQMKDQLAMLEREGGVPGM